MVSNLALLLVIFLSNSVASMAVIGLITFTCHVMVQFMVINGRKTSSVVVL